MLKVKLAEHLTKVNSDVTTRRHKRGVGKAVVAPKRKPVQKEATVAKVPKTPTD